MFGFFMVFVGVANGKDFPVSKRMAQENFGLRHLVCMKTVFSLQNFTSTGRALFHESFDDRKIIFRKTDFKLKMG